MRSFKLFEQKNYSSTSLQSEFESIQKITIGNLIEQPADEATELFIQNFTESDDELCAVPKTALFVQQIISCVNTSSSLFLRQQNFDILIKYLAQANISVKIYIPYLADSKFFDALATFQNSFSKQIVLKSCFFNIPIEFMIQQNIIIVEQDTKLALDDNFISTSDGFVIIDDDYCISRVNEKDPSEDQRNIVVFYNQKVVKQIVDMFDEVWNAQYSDNKIKLSSFSSKDIQKKFYQENDMEGESDIIILSQDKQFEVYYQCNENFLRVALGVISGIIFVPSILLFIFTRINMNSFKFLEGTEGENVGKAAVRINFLFAIMAFFIGVFGVIESCCFKKCSKCCCSKIVMFSYVVLTVLFSLVFLVFGIIFAYFGADSEQILSDFCQKGQIGGSIDLQELSTKVGEIDTMMRNYTTSYMCTTYCPCPNDLDPSKWTEERLTDNNRTAMVVSYIENGQEYTSLFKVVNAYEKNYLNFWDCYQDLKSSTSQYSSQYNIEEISEEYYDLFQQLEDEFKCNGICKAGAFYYFRQIYEGQPYQNCLESIKARFEYKSLAIGVLLLVQFFFTFLAFITTYSSYCCISGKRSD